MIGRSIAMPAASKSPPQEEEREGEKRRNCVIIFVIYLGEILDRI